MDPINPQPTNQEITDTTPNMPQNEPVKKNNWITIVSVSLFIISTLGIVIFLYMQNQKLKGMIAEYQSVSTPSPTPDPTANWKTYNSQELGISFKYPSDKISVNSIEKRITLSLIGKSNLIYFDFSPDSDFCVAAVPVNEPEIKSITIEKTQYPVTGCFFGEGGADGGGNVTSYVANITSVLKIIILKNYEFKYDANGKEQPIKITTEEDLNLANQILSTTKFNQ